MQLVLSYRSDAIAEQETSRLATVTDPSKKKKRAHPATLRKSDTCPRDERDFGLFGKVHDRMVARWFFSAQNIGKTASK